MHMKILASIFLTISSFFFGGSHLLSGATPFQPWQGGTGTSTPPTYGKMLVGNAGGTYTLTSTSSLGITGGGTPGGSNTQVQFNDSGSFGGNAALTFNKSNGTLSLVNSGVGTTNITYQGFSSTFTGSPFFNANNNIQALGFDDGGAQLTLGDGASNANVFSIYSSGTNNAVLDTSALSSSDKTFIFPNWSGNFLVASTTSLYQDVNGKIGIASSTPFASLSIIGTEPLAVGTTTGKLSFGVDKDGHRYTAGPAPAISSCGTGTGTVVGDDQAGTITTATAATACTVTFAKAYASTPTCTVTDNSLVGFADVASISTSAVTFGISSALTGGLLYYNCTYHHP